MAYGNDGLGAIPRGAKRGGAVLRRKVVPRSAGPRVEGWSPARPRTTGTTEQGARLFGRGVRKRGGGFGLGESFVPTTLDPSFRSNFIGIGSDADGLGGLFSKKKKAPAKTPGVAAPIDVRAKGQTYTAAPLNYSVDKKGIARDLTTGQSLSGKEVTARAQQFAAQTGQAVAAAKKVKKNIFQKIGGSVSQAAKNIAKNPLKNLVLPVVGAAVAGVAVTKGVKALKAASAAKKLGGAAKKAADVAKDAKKKKSALDLLKKGGGVGLTIAGIAAKGKVAKESAGIEPFAQLPIESAIPGAVPIPEELKPIVETAVEPMRRRRPVNIGPDDAGGGDTFPPTGSGPFVDQGGPSVTSRIEDLISTIAPKSPERAASIAQTASDLAQNAGLFRDQGAGFSSGGGGGGGFFSGGSSSLPSSTDPSLQPIEEPMIFGVPTKTVLVGAAVVGGLWLATRKRRKGA